MNLSWIRFCYWLSLALLPLAGVGVVRLSTGIDTGAGLQPSWAALAVATVGVLITAGRRDGLRDSWRRLDRALPRRWQLGFLLVAASLVFSAAGLRVAPAPDSAATVWSRYARQMIQAAIMACFVLWPALVTRGEERWRATSRWMFFGLVFQLAYAMVQGISFYFPNAIYSGLEQIFTSNPSILSGSEQLYLGDVFRNIPRLRGTMCEPLYLGSFLVMVWPWLAWSGDAGRWRRVGLGLALVLLLGTWSRGAWFAAIAQGFVTAGIWMIWRREQFLRVLPRSWPLRWVVLGVATVAVGVLFYLAGDALRMPWERLQQSFSRQDWSNLTRVYSMQAAWRAFLLSPIVGIGWGQFAWHFPLLVDPLGLQSQFDWPMVNNLPLQILSETGLVGGLVWFGIGISLAIGTLRRARRRDRAGERVLAAGISLLGVWVQLLSFSQYNLPHIWVALGLLVAALIEAAPADGAPE